MMLNAALTASGFARYRDPKTPDLGIFPERVRITNVVKCMPPKNAPKPAEITQCRPFFVESLQASVQTRAVVAVGRTAHEQILKAFDHRLSEYKFEHGGEVRLTPALRLFSSYHCSRYNVHTGRITLDEFTAVFMQVAHYLAMGVGKD